MTRPWLTVSFVSQQSSASSAYNIISPVLLGRGTNALSGCDAGTRVDRAEQSLQIHCRCQRRLKRSPNKTVLTRDKRFAEASFAAVLRAPSQANRKGRSRGPMCDQTDRKGQIYLFGHSVTVPVGARRKILAVGPRRRASEVTASSSFGSGALPTNNTVIVVARENRHQPFHATSAIIAALISASSVRNLHTV